MGLNWAATKIVERASESCQLRHWERMIVTNESGTAWHGIQQLLHVPPLRKSGKHAQNSFQAF